jgi:hypothetical protein
MNASAMRKIRTFKRNAFGITLSDSRKNSPLKNWRCTSGQPRELDTASSTTSAKTTVLASAIRVLRHPDAP